MCWSFWKQCQELLKLFIYLCSSFTDSFLWIHGKKLEMNIVSIKAIISMTFSSNKLVVHSYFRVILFVCLCTDSDVHGCFVYMHVCSRCACLVFVEDREGIVFPETGVADHVGASNLTWVSWKNSECSESVSHPYSSGKNLKFYLYVTSCDISRDANYSRNSLSVFEDKLMILKNEDVLLSRLLCAPSLSP